MVLALLIMIFVIVAFVLWCVVRTSCRYDRMVDDAQQEAFIKECRKSLSH